MLLEVEQVLVRAGELQFLELRDGRRLRGPAARLAGEEDAREVARDTRRQNGDRDTGHDLVDTEGHGCYRVYESADQPADDPTERSHPRAVREVREGGAEERPEDHHSLETDVDHAGPLGPQPAETGERDRHRGGDRRAERAARGDVVRVAQHPDEGQEDDAEDEGQYDPAARLASIGLPFGARALLDGAGLPGLGHAGAPSGRAVAVGSASARPTRRCCVRNAIRRTTS